MNLFKFFYSNNIKNYIGLIRRNQNLITNNFFIASYALENKTFIYDTSKYQK